MEKKLNVRTICYTAVFVALSVLANTFSLFIGLNGANAVTFTYTVCFLAGATLGAFPGFLTGVLGDVLGWVIRPSGAFNPVITVITGLIGLIAGLVFKLEKKNIRYLGDISLTVISYVIVLLVCSNLNTVALYFYYIAASGKTFLAYYAVRMPKQLIVWSINLALGLLLIKPVKLLINRKKS